MSFLLKRGKLIMLSFNKSIKKSLNTKDCRNENPAGKKIRIVTNKKSTNLMGKTILVVLLTV